MNGIIRRAEYRGLVVFHEGSGVGGDHRLRVWKKESDAMPVGIWAPYKGLATIEVDGIKFVAATDYHLGLIPTGNILVIEELPDAVQVVRERLARKASPVTGG